MASRQLDEEAIFHIARQLASAHTRATYLDQVCTGDASLRERVEALLRIHEQDRAFLNPDSPSPPPTADAASPTERPGTTINRYCDRNRLTIPERLSLFIQVCQAIQHAHQKGVIHRDIKPSNVLVTLHDGTPIPKVIDFGVAKALNTRLTDRTIYTEHLQVIGTLLYQLVRGDLDWIVTKALEKDRTRRYKTADALAMDVARLLADEPIEARPPSRTYRLHRFLRRNRVVVTAAGLVSLLILSGTVVAFLGWSSAWRSKTDLQEAYHDLERVTRESQDNAQHTQDELRKRQHSSSVADLSGPRGLKKSATLELTMLSANRPRNGVEATLIVVEFRSTEGAAVVRWSRQALPADRGEPRRHRVRRELL